MPHEERLMIKIFLAGIMQGSHVGPNMHGQGYRARLRDWLEHELPEATIYDPWANHQSSLEYDDVTGRDVFLEHNAMCADVDVVVAHVPEASMGTAIEIWEAFRNRRFVITISPLEHNWAIRYCSNWLLPDLKSFQIACQTGELRRRLESGGIL